MKIRIFDHEIDLNNKVNAFVPSCELNHQQQHSLSYLVDEALRNHSSVERIVDLGRHPVTYRQYFKDQLDYLKHFKFIWTFTVNPVAITWLPEDSCVWKISKDKIDKFEYNFYKDLTPNSVLTSPIFEYNELGKGNETRIEDLYNDILINDFLRKRLESSLKNWDNSEETKMIDFLNKKQ